MMPPKLQMPSNTSRTRLVQAVLVRLAGLGILGIGIDEYSVSSPVAGEA